MTIANGVGEVSLVDDAAARHVDDANAGLGLRESRRVEKVGRLLVLRQVNGDEVTLGEQCVKIDQFDAHVLGPVLGDEGIVGYESHTKAEARCATRAPILPRPTIPRVLP